MRPFAFLVCVLAALAGVGPASADHHVGFPQHPALSPDGSVIVFHWAGDLWAAPSSGGVASRLTAHPAMDGRSAFSPDGSMLAFESDRDGPTNIYVMELMFEGGAVAAGQPRRVTVSDSGQTLGGFSADGESILFSSYQERRIYRQHSMYRAPLDGGPVVRISEAYGRAPRMSPDGRHIYFERGYNNWERPIYRGPGSRDVWRLEVASGRFEQVAAGPANEGDAFGLAGGGVVYVSSEDGQNNLFHDDGGAAARQLTDFSPGRRATIGHGVRDLAVSHDGTTAAFAVWDTLYTLDLTAANAEPRALSFIASADDDTADTVTISLDDEISEAALSPDGKTLAVVSRGEVLIRSTEKDRPTRRVTETHARERDLAWSPDGSALYFVSDPEGPRGIYKATVDVARTDIMPQEPADDDAEDNADEATSDEEDADADDDTAADSKAGDKDKDKTPTPGDRWATALTFSIEEVIDTAAREENPLPSPDGRSLLFTRALGDLVLLDLESGEERLLLEGWNTPDVQWAADSRHIVFARQDLDFNSDVFVMDTHRAADGGPAEPRNITRHPDMDVSPRLSRDGKVLYFLSDRDNNNWEYDVYRVFLDRDLERLADYELAEHISGAEKAAAKAKPLDPEKEWNAEPLAFDTDDAYLRVRRIYASPGGEGGLAITPGGSRVIFSGSVGEESGVYSVDHTGRERKSVAGGPGGAADVSLDGKKVVVLSRGRVSATGPEGGKADAMPFDATARVVIAEEQRQKFNEAAITFGETFYHPTIKGLDWPALLERYESLAVETRTDAGFNRVVNMLFGEVDGSHTGIRGGDGFSAPGPDIGYFGVVSTPEGGGHRVERVYDQGAADRGEEGLLAGDLILAIDGEPLARGGVLADLHAAMVGTEGKETLVTVRRDGRERHLLITPHGSGTESNLLYEDEVAQRRARVDRLSGGTIGYLHIRGMSEPSVRDFERDLYAAAHGKRGLVIDVRDNGGGWTTDILLASLTAPPHAYTIPRGADPADVDFDTYPRDRRLIYSYQRPIAVLCNENSFSNAEIFSHSIKHTGRGVLVGTQTFGGVISTGGFGLIDGTFVRQPFRGWYLQDGTDMENNGAMPDIEVPITPADEAAGRTPQLDAAVNALLENDVTRR